MSSRRLWNRRQEGRRPHITAMEGGYVGHGTNAGCPRPKNKNMLLVGIASLRSPRRERPSGRGLGAWRNDNSLSCSSPGTGVSVNKKRGIVFFTLC